jgi:putative glutamine amidotransferase
LSNIVYTDYCFSSGINQRIALRGHKAIGVHHSDELNMDTILDGVSALVLSGGEDINPSIYGQSNTHSRWINKERDTFEIKLLAKAVQKGLKILGICRGHQLLNAVMGGTLYQDIYVEGFGHGGLHALGVNEFGRSLFGSHVIDTNSMHHQGVRDVAPDFNQFAIHSDGLIEGIYSEKYKAIGVQWHPEVMQSHQEVFDWLIS